MAEELPVRGEGRRRGFARFTPWSERGGGRTPTRKGVGPPEETPGSLVPGLGRTKSCHARLTAIMETHPLFSLGVEGDADPEQPHLCAAATRTHGVKFAAR